jgi:peptidoglycan hydrolase-like protein with peptidoglycan-binding domain
MGHEFPHPVLRRGAHGQDVKNLQTCLHRRGYWLGPEGIDGWFGQHTYDAVRKYQFDRWCDHHQIPPFSPHQPVPPPPLPFPPICQLLAQTWPLRVDGVVGYNTWSRLDPDEVGPKSKGSTGVFVFLGQSLLNLGPPAANPPLAVDGIFGDLTEKAVKAFQTARGLTPVDGIIGVKTWIALQS